MKLNARILGITPFEIHGERYFTIYYAHDQDPDTVLQARLPADVIYPDPHVHDRIRVHYVFEVVTQIDKQRR